jgi:hypothetical protein
VIFPVVTQELADRIEKFELEAHLSKALGMQKAPGNPLGVEVARFGKAVCLTIHGAPRLQSYRAIGLVSADITQVEAVLQWFRSRKLRCQIDISPHHSSPDLLIHMADLGLVQTNFLTILYGIPETPEILTPPGMTIEEIPNNDLRQFSSLAVEIEQIDEDKRDMWIDVMASEFAGWRCYIARVGGKPAAHAAMRIASGVAVMMFAETNLEYRGYGCQTALLRQRILDAGKAGCDLVACAAYPGTVSQRNQERAGLRVAYTKALWTDRFYMKDETKEV